jgi:uncharacterized protein YndB with AHSA1/START domain
MATVRKDVVVTARPEEVWDAVRDVGALHDRLVPGFVADTRLEGDTRVVTFAGGAVAREAIVTSDDAARRLVYTVVDGPLPLTHHSASVQVAPEGTLTRLTWVTDLLPDSLAPTVAHLMDQGTTAMARALDGTPAAWLADGVG